MQLQVTEWSNGDATTTIAFAVSYVVTVTVARWYFHFYHGREIFLPKAVCYFHNMTIAVNSLFCSRCLYLSTDSIITCFYCNRRFTQGRQRGVFTCQRSWCQRCDRQELGKNLGGAVMSGP